jgi:hypothetical protein
MASSTQGSSRSARRANGAAKTGKAALTAMMPNGRTMAHELPRRGSNPAGTVQGEVSFGARAYRNIRGFKLGGRGVAAGCSSTRNGPPASRRPTRAIQVPGWTVAGAISLAAGVDCHPEKCRPELRGSMHAGARRCFRKLSST